MCYLNMYTINGINIYNLYVRTSDNISFYIRLS